MPSVDRFAGAPADLAVLRRSRGDCGGARAIESAYILHEKFSLYIISPPSVWAWTPQGLKKQRRGNGLILIARNTVCGMPAASRQSKRGREKAVSGFHRFLAPPALPLRAVLASRLASPRIVFACSSSRVRGCSSSCRGTGERRRLRVRGRREVGNLRGLCHEGLRTSSESSLSKSSAVVGTAIETVLIPAGVFGPISIEEGALEAE